MLDILVYSLATFGAAMVLILTIIGFKVVVGAFTFAAKVGLANSRAAILAKVREDAREKIQAELEKEADKEEAPKG